EFQHGAVRPTLGYQKVLKDSARVAGFAGIGSLDSWQMNEALLTCLRTAPALDHVVPLLMANHEGPLRQATQLWGELFGRQDAAIVIHVAERTPRGIEAFEYFWVENRASGFRGFETAALAAERDNAYVTLHGAFDSEAARWSS